MSYLFFLDNRRSFVVEEGPPPRRAEIHTASVRTRVLLRAAPSGPTAVPRGTKSSVVSGERTRAADYVRYARLKKLPTIDGHQQRGGRDDRE